MMEDGDKNDVTAYFTFSCINNGNDSSDLFCKSRFL